MRYFRMAEVRFPADLLEKSAIEKLEYFRKFTIGHPIIKEVFNRLNQAIREPAGISLIFIYGPPGVGKTTVRLLLEKKLKEEFLASREQDHGIIPVIGIEAVASDTGNFSWKDYYKRTLIALEEPLIDYKINYGARRIARNSEGKLYIDQRINGSEVRYALENALKFRHPLAVLIDEAHHITRMASGRRLQDHLDSLKSLANLSGVPHVLLGTYELLEARNLSGQLSRRSLDIHFRGYGASSTQDIEDFQNVICMFQRNLPLEIEPDLVKHWGFLYERSLGCVGTLKEWLIRAFSVALEERSNTLTLEYLQKQAISITQCTKMANEIEQGQKELVNEEADRDKLLSILGLTGASISNKELTKKPTIVKEKQIKSRKVGQPNPKRTKVGK